MMDQWFDHKLGRTRFQDRCRSCNHKFHVCSTPKAAHAAATKKGYDLETGLCKVCRLISNMGTLSAKRAELVR